MHLSLVVSDPGLVSAMCTLPKPRSNVGPHTIVLPAKFGINQMSIIAVVVNNVSSNAIITVRSLEYASDLKIEDDSQCSFSTGPGFVC